jgi:MoaA/NifB/PqqE/SkfB family radical SAM enzyme
MEPKSQVEIQLGHMCNNRCVFCVSGQETALGRARPLPLEPILASLDEARAKGSAKLTLLGGEPTLQPAFLDVVRHAVKLGFEEIVIFTNGVKTAREELIDDILATGGNFTFRISIQGATKDTHEATTRKPGSFDRILRTMEHLQRKGQRLTVNMCVVQSNYASVPHFPELLGRFGATQLHLDMIRPRDAGARTEEEMRAMLPRYSDMVEPLTRMVQSFPDGFDVNLGNLPYCIAPHLARSIHHDGEHTLTVSVDGERDLSRPWDKYFVKRQDKKKPERCKDCLFEPRCSGIFETYEAYYGDGELRPITLSKLREIDPERRFFSLHVRGTLEGVQPALIAAPFDTAKLSENGEEEVRVELSGADRMVLALRRPGAGAGSFDLASVHVVEAPRDRSAGLRTLRALSRALVDRGLSVLHPLGDDALAPVAPSIARRIVRIRAAASFPRLAFLDVRVLEGGARAELDFVADDGGRATVWLAESNGKPAGGYRVDGAPSPALVTGLRAVMSALGVDAGHEPRPRA